MSTFWISLALTSGITVFSLLLGGHMLLGHATMVLILPHALIGDGFRWRRFPRIQNQERALWITLGALGLAIFLIIRQTGEYFYSLFFVYFFWHFWKDLDIAFGPSVQFARRAKGWCGLLVFVAYVVVSSGLVRDPLAIALARRITWAASAGFFAFWVYYLCRSRTSRQPSDILWSRYLGLAIGFLLLFTWVHALRPYWKVVALVVVIWHFMQWYVFYWLAVRQSAVRKSTGAACHPREPSVSLSGLTALIVFVNLLSAAGALAYVTQPSLHWLSYVYQFPYLAGCWTVMHVTWNWIPKEVRGVRISVV